MLGLPNLTQPRGAEPHPMDFDRLQICFWAQATGKRENNREGLEQGGEGQRGKISIVHGPDLEWHQKDGASSLPMDKYCKGLNRSMAQLQQMLMMADRFHQMIFKSDCINIYLCNHVRANIVSVLGGFSYLFSYVKTFLILFHIDNYCWHFLLSN